MSQQTDALLAVLASGASDLVTLHDGTGLTTRVADRIGPEFPGHAQELVGQHLSRLAVADDVGDMVAAFGAVAAGGTTKYVEWRFADPSDGRIRYCESRISRLGAPGASLQLLCISRLLDDQRGRGEELRARYEYRRQLVDRAAYGIYRSTREGRFVDVNTALVRILGYESPEELYTIDLNSQLYADAAERETLMRRANEGRLGEWSHARWRRKDGSVIVVRIVVNAIKDANGAVVMFEGIVEDVTESLRREEILRRNERMASLGTMLAGVAHELNNPLAAISGFAQIILRGDSLSDDDRGAVETINHEANRAARIVRDLQTFARERSYQQREEVDLNEVVSYVLATQRYQLDTRGVHREVSLAPALPPVSAERAHIEQVLLNLLGNASQALESITNAPADRSSGAETSAPPTITIRSALRDGNVVLEIEDTGPGITPENLPRIFDPFFTTRKEGEGTGLGLAVVHGIVHSYGGTLEVESEVGRGSLFRVGFPALATDPDGAAEESERTAPITPTPAVKPLEILVIEDEIAIRKLLSRYFASRGHSVTTAADGTAAIRAVEQSAFDVVVCDLRLPGIDGFEVLRRVRELPTGRRSRCILMSGANAKAPPAPIRDVLRLSAVIDKPFEIDQLRRVVESAE